MNARIQSFLSRLFPCSEIESFYWDRSLPRTIGRIGAALSAWIVVQLIGVIAVIGVLNAFGVSVPKKGLAGLGFWPWLMNASVPALGLLAGIWVMNKGRKYAGDWRTTWSEAIAFTRSSIKGRMPQFVLMSVVLLYASNGLISFIYLVFPIPEPVDEVAKMIGSTSGATFALMVFFGAVVMPILEEVFFRGFIFNSLRLSLAQSRLDIGTSVSTALAVIMSAAVFAVAHFEWSLLPSLFVTGVIFTEVYRRTGSLYASITCHMVNNFLAMMVLLFA